MGEEGNRIVSLNVGGTVYSTSVATLLSHRDCFFEAMFARFNTSHSEDEHGQVFIDRDGSRFRHILNYLRTGSCHLEPSLSNYSEILEEAEFFALDGLARELRGRMDTLHAKEKRHSEEAENWRAERAASAVCASEAATCQVSDSDEVCREALGPLPVNEAPLAPQRVQRETAAALEVFSLNDSF